MRYLGRVCWWRLAPKYIFTSNTSLLTKECIISLIPKQLFSNYFLDHSSVNVLLMCSSINHGIYSLCSNHYAFLLHQVSRMRNNNQALTCNLFCNRGALFSITIGQGMKLPCQISLPNSITFLINCLINCSIAAIMKHNAVKLAVLFFSALIQV